LQGSLLQIDIAQIIVDEGDEPNSLVDFLDAEPLSGQDSRDVDFLSVDADTAAGGDEDVAVVEGVFEVGEALIGRLEEGRVCGSSYPTRDMLNDCDAEKETAADEREQDAEEAER